MKKISVLLVALLCAALLCGCMSVEQFYDNNSNAVDLDSITSTGSFTAKLWVHPVDADYPESIRMAKSGATMEYDNDHPLVLVREDDTSDRVTIPASAVELYDYTPSDSADSTGACCYIRVNYSGLKAGKTYRFDVSNFIMKFKASADSAVQDCQVKLLDDEEVDDLKEFTVAKDVEKPEGFKEQTGENGEVAPQVFEVPAPAEEVDVDEATEESEETDDEAVKPDEDASVDEAYTLEEAEEADEEEAPRTGDGSESFALIMALTLAGLFCAVVLLRRTVFHSGK